jgi:hypothetical protein
VVVVALHAVAHSSRTHTHTLSLSRRAPSHAAPPAGGGDSREGPANRKQSCRRAGHDGSWRAHYRRRAASSGERCPYTSGACPVTREPPARRRRRPPPAARRLAARRPPPRRPPPAATPPSPPPPPSPPLAVHASLSKRKTLREEGRVDPWTFGGSNPSRHPTWPTSERAGLQRTGALCPTDRASRPAAAPRGARGGHPARRWLRRRRRNVRRGACRPRTRAARPARSPAPRERGPGLLRPGLATPVLARPMGGARSARRGGRSRWGR